LVLHPTVHPRAKVCSFPLKAMEENNFIPNTGIHLSDFAEMWNEI
jgi:hypothetical protein